MEICFDTSVIEGYSSNSQKARVLTENWVATNMYCPVCGHPSIGSFPNNAKVADFFCPDCKEQYELKSKNGRFGKKVADGAYHSFVQRITEKSNPDFLFMSYRISDMRVHDLCFIPKFFFVPEMAEKRKPLGEKARRKGWVGCNILFDQIPLQGKIAIIQDMQIVDKKIVREKVKRAFDIRIENLDSRGWLFDVLHCVNSIENDRFSLDQVYQFEEALKYKHPDNHNIRPKIRQQLQVMRDKNIIEFLGNGEYRKI